MDSKVPAGRGYVSFQEDNSSDTVIFLNPRNLINQICSLSHLIPQQEQGYKNIHDNNMRKKFSNDQAKRFVW